MPLTCNEGSSKEIAILNLENLPRTILYEELVQETNLDAILNSVKSSIQNEWERYEKDDATYPYWLRRKQLSII